MFINYLNIGELPSSIEVYESRKNDFWKREDENSLEFYGINLKSGHINILCTDKIKDQEFLSTLSSKSLPISELHENDIKAILSSSIFNSITQTITDNITPRVTYVVFISK